MMLGLNLEIFTDYWTNFNVYHPRLLSRNPYCVPECLNARFDLYKGHSSLNFESVLESFSNLAA